jgi:hypothetical protein
MSRASRQVSDESKIGLEGQWIWMFGRSGQTVECGQARFRARCRHRPPIIRSGSSFQLATPMINGNINVMGLGSKRSRVLWLMLSLLGILVVVAERSPHIFTWLTMSRLKKVPIVVINPKTPTDLVPVKIRTVEMSLPKHLMDEASIEKRTTAEIRLDMIRWKNGTVYVLPIRENDGITWEWQMQPGKKSTYAQRVAQIYEFSTDKFNFWSSRADLKRFERNRGASTLFRDKSADRIEVFDHGETSATIIIPKRGSSKTKIFCDVVKDDKNLVPVIVEGNNFDELHEIARTIATTLRILPDEIAPIKSARE